MDKEILFCPPKNRKHIHTKTKGINKGDRDVNNNVISVYVNVKSNKTKSLGTEDDNPLHENFSLPLIPKTNSKKRIKNTNKFVQNGNISGGKPILTKSFIKTIPQTLKMKKLKTLNKSTNFNTASIKLKKKETITKKTEPKGKIDVLFEFERCTLLLQKNIRRLLAYRKMERLKVTKLIQGNDSSMTEYNNIDSDSQPIVLKKMTFKKESSSSDNSIENKSRSKKSIAKNKSANLLGLQSNTNINDSMSSMRSGVSHVSVDLDELSLSDEDDDDDEFF